MARRSPRRYSQIEEESWNLKMFALLTVRHHYFFWELLLGVTSEIRTDEQHNLTITDGGLADNLGSQSFVISCLKQEAMHSLIRPHKIEGVCLVAVAQISLVWQVVLFLWYSDVNTCNTCTIRTCARVERTRFREECSRFTRCCILLNTSLLSIEI